MKAKFFKQYRSAKTGTPVFMYTVTGTKDEVAAFEEVQGENLVIDEDEKSATKDQPFWFTVRYAGPKVDLLVTTNNKIVADTSDLNAAASLAEQYPALASEIAKRAVDKLYGNTGNTVTTNAVAPAKKAVDSLD